MRDVGNKGRLQAIVIPQAIVSGDQFIALLDLFRNVSEYCHRAFMVTIFAI